MPVSALQWRGYTKGFKPFAFPRYPKGQRTKDMKNRIFMTVLFSAGFALAAVAQQSSSGAAPAATGPGASQPASSKPASNQDFWEGDEPSLGSLILHPFATKEYVP